MRLAGHPKIIGRRFCALLDSSCRCEPPRIRQPHGMVNSHGPGFLSGAIAGHPAGSEQSDRGDRMLTMDPDVACIPAVTVEAPEGSGVTSLLDFVSRSIPSSGEGQDVPPWLAEHGQLAVARARRILLHGRGLEWESPSFARYVLCRMPVPGRLALKWFHDRPVERAEYLALHPSGCTALSVLAASGLLTRVDRELEEDMRQGFRDEVLVILGKIVRKYRDEAQG